MARLAGVDDLTAAPRTAWDAGQLLLACVLGVSIGLPAAPAWLPGLVVLAAVVLGILRPVPAPVWASALAVLLILAITLDVVVGERRIEAAVLAASAALVHAAVVALPIGLVAVARGRRRHRQQGWELARSLAREERSRTEAALVRERAAMAGEIHDSLGHRLTLVSVQLGQLSLDTGLPSQAHRAVEAARRGVAEAAAELGETVQLLKAGGPSRVPTDPSLSGLVEDARAAGVRVDGELPGDLDRDLSAHARAALGRVLSEALANAAKHAPGQTVHLEARAVDGAAVLIASNARGPDPQGSAASSGHGLPALRHRLTLLGGALEVEQGEQHVVRATVPVDARPRGEKQAEDGLTEVVAAQRTGDRRARRVRRLTWAVPAGLTAGAVLVIVAGFLYLTLGSVLPPDDFARIQVGMPQEEAEEILPGFEMLEAPRDALPEQEGTRCSYHEESASFFTREDVFRVCFDDAVVVSTDTIPAA